MKNLFERFSKRNYSICSDDNFIIMGRKDPHPIVFEDHKLQIIKGLQEMKLYFLDKIHVASKFYRLCNKKQCTTYYSNDYGRKSNRYESYYVEFMNVGSTGITL